jgi:hypothetical protein
MFKRTVYLALVIFLAFCFASVASAKSTYSDDATASGAVATGNGVFEGIWIGTDGTNAVTVTVYDNATAASGRQFFPTWVISTSAANRAQAVSFEPGLPYGNGIYVSVTCAGTVHYVVYYDPR